MKLKKPKFWDYDKPNFISHLLSPLAKIFEFILKFSKKSKNKISGIKSICVGNIYVGGTGKTSIAIELKKILDKEKIKTCFIKKEYKDQIDEQKLLEKFGKTFINRSRLKALKNAIKENYDLAISDDGLQDTNISYDLSFVCFNKKAPKFKAYKKDIYYLFLNLFDVIFDYFFIKVTPIRFLQK